MAGDGPDPHHFAHARLVAALGSAAQGIHLIHALGGQLVDLHIGLNAGPAGPQPDGHTLGAVALVDGQQLALDQEILGVTLRIPKAPLGPDSEAADLFDQFFGQGVGHLVAHLDLLGGARHALVFLVFLHQVCTEAFIQLDLIGGHGKVIDQDEGGPRQLGGGHVRRLLLHVRRCAA